MYELTLPAANGATDMWVEIPAGFPMPVAIDVLRATGHAACFRISGTPRGGLVVDPAGSADFTGRSRGTLHVGQQHDHAVERLERVDQLDGDQEGILDGSLGHDRDAGGLQLDDR
jgi:hypothetical protein